MLTYRIATALIGLPLFVYLVHIGGPLLVLAVMLLSSVAILEFYGAAERQGTAPYRYPGILLGWILVAHPYLGSPGLGLFCAFLVLALILSVNIFVRPESPLVASALTILGAAYGGGFFGLLVYMRAQFSAHPVYVALIASWGYDTAAFITGRRWGRHKLSPGISPKKSIEGAVGGTLGATVLLVLYSLATAELGPGTALIVGPVTGLVAPLGDLAASLLKREAGLKDFGATLPGHGGVIDRFDSLFFVLLPVLLIQILG